MNFADAGQVVAGRWGFWVFGTMLTVKVRTLHRMTLSFLMKLM